MNLNNLDAAKRRIPNTSVLINVVSKRVKQLVVGDRPLVKVTDPNEDIEDIVLREIAEGKLVAEIDFSQTRNLPKV
ncbi:MAG: DNA-directed RNA polymerase subunit omega [Lentisphaerae bacterium]|nr:DNA-directed RNA polymerase subunit omega [Lentisphaerota bacterium]